jgi:hypothetical protein
MRTQVKIVRAPLVLVAFIDALFLVSVAEKKERAEGTALS